MNFRKLAIAEAEAIKRLLGELCLSRCIAEDENAFSGGVVTRCLGSDF